MRVESHVQTFPIVFPSSRNFFCECILQLLIININLLLSIQCSAPNWFNKYGVEEGKGNPTDKISEFFIWWSAWWGIQMMTSRNTMIDFPQVRATEMIKMNAETKRKKCKDVRQISSKYLSLENHLPTAGTEPFFRRIVYKRTKRRQQESDGVNASPVTSSSASMLCIQI